MSDNGASSVPVDPPIAVRVPEKLRNHPTIKRMEALHSTVANAYLGRLESLRKWLDPRRDIYHDCGYPDDPVPAEVYQELFDREAIPNRVVNVWPKECWQVSPRLYEIEDENTWTPFEIAWKNLGKSLSCEPSYYDDDESEGHPIWEYLERADILSGIGRYGIILLGLNDKRPLNQPAWGYDPYADRLEEGVGSSRIYYNYGESLPSPVPLPVDIPLHPQPKITEERKLTYLRVFPEHLATISVIDNRKYSPRYGRPLKYQVTMLDSNAMEGGVIGATIFTDEVHWTRVVHIADNLQSSEVWGNSRMRPVLNRLLDLRKLQGGSAEMYWRGAFPGLSVETIPQLGADVEIEDEAALRDVIEQYMNSLQRYILLQGMTAKPLSPQVVDPTGQINIQTEAICIQLTMPTRIFKGSERGEMASSQDDDAWNDRVKGRNRTYTTPRVIVPLTNRFINLQLLPKPSYTDETRKSPHYCIHWPDITSQSASDKANVGATITGAIAQYVGGGIDALVPPNTYFTKVLGWAPDEVAEMLDSAPSDISQGESSEIESVENCGGPGSGVPGPCPTGSEGGDSGGSGSDPTTTPAIQSKIGRLASVVANLPAAVKDKAIQVIKNKYAKFEKRYGTTGAKLLIAATIAAAPIPLPGTAFAPVLIAEGVRAIAGAFGKGPAAKGASTTPSITTPATSSEVSTSNKRRGILIVRNIKKLTPEELADEMETMYRSFIEEMGDDLTGLAGDDTDEELGIPSREEMLKVAREMLNEISSDTQSSSISPDNKGG